MNRLPRFLPAYVALALILGAGLVHGFWTHRWLPSRAGLEAAARLNKVPLNLGDWQGVDLPMTDQETEAITGHLCRRYRNRSTGAVVTILLLSGDPGPVGIHTPDVCYRAGGFDVATPIKYKYSGEGMAAPAVFLTADLHKKRAAEQLHQRIFWTWSAGGQWQAPADPRAEYAAEPVLFKLYLVREMNAAGEPLDDDPCLDLMHQLLPQLRQTLFAS